MEDKMSGQLFAACPVDNYPGVAVEAVTDSSRYFVLCIQDSGRKAYIGIGFADRSDSFDLNVIFLNVRSNESIEKLVNPNTIYISIYYLSFIYFSISITFFSILCNTFQPARTCYQMEVA